MATCELPLLDGVANDVDVVCPASSSPGDVCSYACAVESALLSEVDSAIEETLDDGKTTLKNIARMIDRGMQRKGQVINELINQSILSLLRLRYFSVIYQSRSFKAPAQLQHT